MSMKTKAVILISSAAALLFIVVGGLEGVRASNNNDGAYRQLQVYSEVLSRVRSEYVEEPNIPLVTDGALHGLLESLDANSSYLSAAEYKDYKAHKTEARGEIGAAVSKRFGYAAVISVIPGGPADKAGLQATDIMEAIEGKSTREMSLAEIHNLLSGQPGSNVTVALVRARRAEPQKTVITRELVTIPPVADKMMEDGIGYLQVDAFPKGKTQEISNKIKALQKQGAKKLILDVRNCAEGEESEGIATANLFLSHGTITYLQGQKYPKEAFNAESSKAITNSTVSSESAPKSSTNEASLVTSSSFTPNCSATIFLTCCSTVLIVMFSSRNCYSCGLRTPATSGIDRARILCERGGLGYLDGIFVGRPVWSTLTKHRD